MHGQRKINSPTQPGFKQNKEASPLEGQILKAVADAGGLPSPDTEQSNIGAGGPNKRLRAGCATDLKRLPTPINLFEDECVFCHSFRTTDLFHGPMVRYRNGRVLSIDEGNSSNAIYVHKKCLEWAPKVWYDGDTVMNLESEIRRASRLRCRRCGLLGAALGCYEKHCRKSYHVPCAVQIIDCRWDVAKGHLLCPEHVSKTLPCDKLRTHRKGNYSCSLRQSRFSCKEEPFTNFKVEGQQSHLHNTTSSFLPVGKCADKEGNNYVLHRGNQQTDQFNITNTSSFPQSQPSHKEGISPNSSRGGKQMDQLNTMSSCLPGSLYTKKEENFVNHQRKNQQTDQRNISNPSYLPSSQHSQKEGFSTNNSRDGQIDQLDTSSSSLPLGQHSYYKATSKNHERDNQRIHECNTSNLSSPQSCHLAEGISIAFQGKETTTDQLDTSSCPSDQLVLFGLSLSVSEKDILQSFVCSISVTLMEEWAKDVTHVIVAKGAGSSWSRSFEVLMAILLGRWVVHFESAESCLLSMYMYPRGHELGAWASKISRALSGADAFDLALSGVAGCLGTLQGLEAAYEVRTIDGPKKGRMRAAEGAPNLFSGLCFCLSDYMNPANRDCMRDLIAAAEGRVLEKRDLHLQLRKPDDSSVKPFFVYDVDPLAEFSSSTLHKEMEEAREQAAAGAQVICHLKVLDAIAAYDAAILNVKEA